MDNKKKIAFFVLLFSLAMAGCKKWDKHNEIAEQDLTKSLLQVISETPSLSKFREFVGLAGLDSVLQSTKTFTVWAPNNTAMQSVDPNLVLDPIKLRAFVLNHISNQLYFTKDVTVPLRIQMLNGKYNTFSNIKFEEADLETKDRYVQNGVLHSIKTFVPPLQSIWEFINATTGTYTQNAYVASLNFIGFDPATAIVDSISSITGLPVYRPGTGLVPRNLFNDRVYDLKREDKQYTYFVMQDANFALEADSLKPYYVAATTTITDSLTRWNTVKDLAYDVAYPTIANIPLSLISKSGISVPVNTSFVVSVQKMSNGYIYILSKLDVPTKNKFLTLTLEGENPTGFLQNDKTSFIHYRIRLNPVTSTNFNDIYILGHGVTTFYSYNRTTETPSIKYSVYAKATNDFQAAAFSETINAWNTSLATVVGTLPFAVPLNSTVGAFNEVYLGDITNTRYGNVDWRATAITTGPILLDYLRLVPQP